MTVRKEPRRGAVILFASMFLAGNPFFVCWRPAPHRLYGKVGRKYEAAYQNEITTPATKSLALTVKNWW
jgi:hypothetical protein